MNLKEIRESSLLEYYVLGILSAEETREVEGYLLQFPQLNDDYLALQRTAEMYARAHKVTPSASVKTAIFDALRDDFVVPKNDDGDASNIDSKSLPEKKKRNWFWPFLAVLFGGIAAAAWWNGGQVKDRLDTLRETYDRERIECDSIQEIQERQEREIQIYRQLGSANNRMLAMAPTEGYPQTNLLFHTNQTAQQNYIQVHGLPPIATNQAYQLWSLKAEGDPVPLTVFKGDTLLIPVDFEPGTATYAITIEREEGVQSPTLSRLIGTVTL